MDDLFRREALENRKARTLGDVIIINPPSFAVLTGVTLLTLALIAAFLFWCEYARKETVIGYLVPDKGLVKLHAPFAGVVTARRVEEGTPVRAGDTLFVVAASGSAVDVTVTREVERSRAALRKRIEQESRANELEVRALLRKIESLKAELDKSAQELNIQRQRLELDTQALRKLNDLADQGHYPLQQFHQREREHLELRALIEAVERNRLTLTRELRSAQSLVEIGKLRNAARLNDYASQISQLDQRLAELAARTAFEVRAPVNGVATGVITEVGQSVTPGEPLLAILPNDSTLQARLYVPTRASGFVKPGQEVLVRFQAFPYQRFGLHSGTVARVSKAILAPSETGAPLTLSEPVYTATVALKQQTVDAYGTAMPLRPGMLLEADIVLDRHSLLRWLFDPLYGLQRAL